MVVVCCLSFGVRCVLCVAYCVLFVEVVCCLMFAGCGSLLLFVVVLCVVCCVVWGVCCLLCVVWCVLLLCSVPECCL